jgi:hypothetical protein
MVSPHVLETSAPVGSSARMIGESIEQWQNADDALQPSGKCSLQSSKSTDYKACKTSGTLHLRELARNGLIKRVVFNELPLRVDYSITEHGKSVYKLLMTMFEWGKTHLNMLEEQKTTPNY